MTKKEERRYNILLGAFRLFLVKEYADVTTADIEEITRLSRGAIYYKVKNKGKGYIGLSLTSLSSIFCPSPCTTIYQFRKKRRFGISS